MKVVFTFHVDVLNEYTTTWKIVDLDLKFLLKILPISRYTAINLVIWMDVNTEWIWLGLFADFFLVVSLSKICCYTQRQNKRMSQG